MDRRNGVGYTNDHENDPPQLENIKEEEPVPFPVPVGYYLQKELESDPYELNKKDYQLDKELIREINSQESFYRFSGTAVDFQKENQHNPIFRNTVVLENYIDWKRPRENNKLRIFARGGNLCDFLMGTGITPISTLHFDYNEEENILRFEKPAITWDIRTFEFSKVGEHRLTGDKKEVVDVGKESSYKVMELITDDYELYYSKEVDGFDGDDPIEIRGVMQDLGLKAIKILYRSIALADIKKLVVMVSKGDGDDRIKKITIIDDFSRHDRNSTKNNLFKELKEILGRFIPVFKKVKRGLVVKAVGGMIIIPEAVESPGQAEILCQAGFNGHLWNLLQTRGDFVDSPLPAVLSEKRLYLCLQNPESFLQLFELVRGMAIKTIIACFFEYHRNPMEPSRKVKDEAYHPVIHYWRKIVHENHPELLFPLLINKDNVFVCSPFVYNAPRFNDHRLYNNTPWILSKAHNVLVANIRYDVRRILDTLSTPLPDLPHHVSMTVYTQESCEDVLKDFFGDLITFEEPHPSQRVIFCIIHQIQVNAKEFRATVFNALKIEDVYTIRSRNTADLYLISKDDVINEVGWDNKVDLQLMEDFYGFDSIRTIPHTVVVFSSDTPKCPEAHKRVIQIVESTHSLDPDSQGYPLLYFRRSLLSMKKTQFPD